MIVDPVLGPVYVLNSGVSDEFYPIILRPGDGPKLGLVLFSAVDGEELVAVPLTLPMV